MASSGSWCCLAVNTGSPGSTSPKSAAASAARNQRLSATAAAARKSP
jgi:hypothetical protein